jgi:hypothetical protein
MSIPDTDEVKAAYEEVRDDSNEVNWGAHSLTVLTSGEA